MTAAKKSNDELLIENAILRAREDFVKMLDSRLAPINSKLSGLSDDSLKSSNYMINWQRSVDDKIQDINNVIKPFRTVRERVWISIVFASLGATAVGSGSLLMIKELLNK